MIMTDRAPRKAFSNEIKSPFVVEVPVAANGLDVELNLWSVFTKPIWRRLALQPSGDAR
jgi:hypothetical protein